MTMTGNVAEKLTPTNAEGSNAAHSASSKAHVISRIPSACMSSQSQTPSVSSLTPSISLPIQNPSISSSSSPLSGKNTSPKGASGKDYLMNKYEPRNYERTTSHGTSGAMSPRRSSSNVGVMERVKGAVNSLLRNEEPSQQKYGVKTPTTRTSSQITTAQEGKAPVS